MAMPLVRISLLKCRPPGLGKKIGRVVYESMVATISVPEHDLFEIVTEHDGEGLIYDPTYLNIARTDGFVIIQITLSEGRSVDLKKNLYRTIAERLHQQLAIRPEDVFINLVEVKKENWSFGNGIAQYVA